MGTPQLVDRIDRERDHAAVLLETDAIHRPWTSPAGVIRKQRRTDFLIGRFERLPPQPKVLEVGCGTGLFTEDFARTFEHLTAIDVAEDLLAVARRRLPRTDIRNGDLHHLPFEDGSFDLVVGCSILHHVDWDAALREISRVLKPRGRVRFCEPNLLNPQIFLQKNWPWLKRMVGDSPDEYAFTPGQIRRSLALAGFLDIDVKPFEFLHPMTPSVLIQPILAAEKILELTPLVQMGGSMKIAASWQPSPAST